MSVYQVNTIHAASCRDICGYLTHDERAIGYAYNHCVEKDLHGRSVYQQLDEARRALGGNLAYGKQELTTAYHLIISPLKADYVLPEELLDYTTTLLNLYVPDFSAFVVIHDDNTNHIPHAHVVLNNVSVSRAGQFGGLRASNALPLSRNHEFSRERSRLAAERGWHAFTREGVLVSAKAWFEQDARQEEIYELKQREAEQGLDDRDRERLAELFRAQPPVNRRYIKKDIVDQYVEKKGTSWKADLRDRISLACLVSKDEPSFFEALDALKVGHRPSESKKHPEEYVYTHPASKGHGVRGDRLGLYWSRWGTKKRLDLRENAYDGWVADLHDRVVGALGSMEPEKGDPMQSLGHAIDGVVTAGRLLEAFRVLDDRDVHAKEDVRVAWAEPILERERDEFQAAGRMVMSLGILPDERPAWQDGRISAFGWRPSGGRASSGTYGHDVGTYAPTLERGREMGTWRDAPERDGGLCV